MHEHDTCAEAYTIACAHHSTSIRFCSCCVLALSPGPIHSSFSGFTACIIEKLGIGYGEEANYIMHHADKMFDFGNRGLC